MLNILLIYFILFIIHYILYIFIETSSISSWKYIVYLKKTHELHPGSTSKAAENGLGDDISCRKSLIHGKLTITAHEKHLAWLIYDSWDEPPSMHFYIVFHKLRNGDQLVGRLICREFWASQKVLFEQKVSRANMS